MASGSAPRTPPLASALEVFKTYLPLGLTSFGGPIAHLGYFHRELVQRRRWVSEEDYAQLLALCQFLPGPASSQLGFGLGLLRAGWLGAVAAFVGFTLPSALLMLLFATVLPQLSGPLGQAFLHGLALVAVAVVAHGVLAMGRRLCPDFTRVTIAALVIALMLVIGGAWAQIGAVLLGALAGLLLCRPTAPSGESPELGYGRRRGALLLLAFALLLALLPWLAESGPWALGAAFYRAGALVFGGGHVVLPLLEEMVVAPGWVGADDFLAGYGAAQAIPGPMFTFSVFLGASSTQGGGLLSGALVALVGIFLPGFLLLGGVLPWWRAVVSHPAAARAVAGVNAAVVGLLAAALYDPVWQHGIAGWGDFLIALAGFFILWRFRASALWVVAWCVGSHLTLTILVG